MREKSHHLYLYYAIHFISLNFYKTFWLNKINIGYSQHWNFASFEKKDAKYKKEQVFFQQH